MLIDREGTNTKEAEIRTWEVGGVVAGVAVPTELVPLGEILFGPEQDPVLSWVSQTRQPQVAQVQTTATSFTQTFPPRVEVESTAIAMCSVSACSAEEAQRLGCRRIEEACVALAMGTSYASYSFNLRAIRLPGEQLFATPYSNEASFVWHEARDMAEDEIDRTRQILRASEEDDVARQALSHLRTAWSLSYLPNSEHLAKARLLRLFQVIEVVSSSVASKWRDMHGERIREANRTSIATLKRKLTIQGSVTSLVRILAAGCSYGRSAPERYLRKEAAAVRECSLELRRNAADFLSLQIEVAGNQLGVPEDVVGIASRLCKIRNRELGHPGELSEDGLALLSIANGDNGIDLAEQAARTYFAQYCSNLLKPQASA